MVPMAAPAQATACVQQQYDDARRLQEEENILRRAREIEAARQAPVLSNQRMQELKEQDFRRQRAQQVPTSLAPGPPVAPEGPAGHGEAARAPAAASAQQSAGQGNQGAAPPAAAEQAPAPAPPPPAEEEEEEEDGWDEWWWYQGGHQGGQAAAVPAWHQDYIDAGWFQDDSNPHIWWKQHWDGHWQRWKQPATQRQN